MVEILGAGILLLAVGIILFNIFFAKEKVDLGSLFYVPWRIRFTTITEKFASQPIEVYYAKICKAAARYHAADARRIFIEAHLFTMKHSVLYSLLFYLHYLHVGAPAASFPHKKLSTLSKEMLFADKRKEAKFLQICVRLKADRNLHLAIDETKILLLAKRREICLDEPEITKAVLLQSQTAEILERYLQDDEESPPECEASVSFSMENNYENALFHLFEEHNYMLNKKGIDTFARDYGEFPDSLIQQINETYYEIVDDVLIEDDGDKYIINKTYYKKIKDVSANQH